MICSVLVASLVADNFLYFSHLLKEDVKEKVYFWEKKQAHTQNLAWS